MPNGSQYKRRAFVTISYDPESGVAVSEDPVYIMRRGEIEWRCQDRDWTVTVEDDEALFEGGNTVRGERGQRSSGVVRRDAHGGRSAGRRYKYTVAVAVNGTTVEKDPEVIVGPEEPDGD